MSLLVTPEQAIAHLRLDWDASPISADVRYPDLVLKIDQAEAIIFNYLKLAADASIDGDPDASPVVPPLWTTRDRSNVQAAVLFALSALYDDADARTLADYMTAPAGVIVLLLARLRDPALR